MTAVKDIPVVDRVDYDAIKRHAAQQAEHERAMPQERLERIAAELSSVIGAPVRPQRRQEGFVFCVQPPLHDLCIGFAFDDTAQQMLARWALRQRYLVECAKRAEAAAVEQWPRLPVSKRWCAEAAKSELQHADVAAGGHSLTPGELVAQRLSPEDADAWIGRHGE